MAKSDIDILREGIPQEILEAANQRISLRISNEVKEPGDLEPRLIFGVGGSAALIMLGSTLASGEIGVAYWIAQLGIPAVVYAAIVGSFNAAERSCKQLRENITYVELSRAARVAKALRGNDE